VAADKAGTAGDKVFKRQFSKPPRYQPAPQARNLPIVELVVASSPHPSHSSIAYSMDSSIPVHYTPSREVSAIHIYITAEMQPAPNSKGIRFKVGVTVRLPNNPGDIIAKEL